jgi:hypothetical protein
MRHALLCHNLRTLMHWLVITILHILVRPMCNFHVEHITLNCVCKKALIIHLVIIYVLFLFHSDQNLQINTLLLLLAIN